jgi:acyl-CoA thioesterase YciA
MPDIASFSPAASQPRLALRVATLPRDTNHYGTIFGGVILSYIDQAGFIEARTHGAHRWVTAALDKVIFQSPVHVGDIVNLYTKTTRTGTTSVTIEVQVEAERFTTGERVGVTSAQLVMVAVDGEGKPVPYKSKPTV